MAETPRTEAVSISALTDGDTIVLADGTTVRVGDYITWEPDGAHLEGVTSDGDIRAVVLPKDEQVQRLIEDRT